MSDIKKQDPEWVERFKDAFDEMVVYKDLKRSNFISSFKLPSFMRDWVIKRFQDEDGEIDVEQATEFIREFIPKKDDWRTILDRVVNRQETVRFLAKISISIDIKTQTVSFELPDFGLGVKQTVIPSDVWDRCSSALLKSEENWGVVELGYLYPLSSKEPGKIKLTDFQDFCPYIVDLDDFKYARESFSLQEWIDIILGAVDYNAEGYKDMEQKLTMLQRLLPFVEKQINLLELAPAGTGKSYLFGQISRHGWLVSGKVTRAKLIYDLRAKRTAWWHFAISSLWMRFVKQSTCRIQRSNLPCRPSWRMVNTVLLTITKSMWMQASFSWAIFRPPQ